MIKAPTGIPGFDSVTKGGFVTSSASLLDGGAGSGKTILALQFLVNGARQYGEPGIFVAFEEDSRRIVANAASFGWGLPGLEQEGLFFLHAQLSPDLIPSGDRDLEVMLSVLETKARAMGAKLVSTLGVLNPCLTLLGKPFRKVDLAMTVRRVIDSEHGSSLPNK